MEVAVYEPTIFQIFQDLLLGYSVLQGLRFDDSLNLVKPNVGLHLYKAVTYTFSCQEVVALFFGLCLDQVIS